MSPQLHSALGSLGKVVNPALFVALIVVLLRTRREWSQEALWKVAFGGRVLLSCMLAWLLTHPEKLGVVLRGFDASSHTAFFLVPALGLCALSAKWARVVAPLGVGYGVFMALMGFHTWAEILLSAMIVGPVVWLCLRAGEREATRVRQNAEARKLSGT